jgi:hypothetical protein
MTTILDNKGKISITERVVLKKAVRVKNDHFLLRVLQILLKNQCILTMASLDKFFVQQSEKFSPRENFISSTIYLKPLKVSLALQFLVWSLCSILPTLT